MTVNKHNVANTYPTFHIFTLSTIVLLFKEMKPKGMPARSQGLKGRVSPRKFILSLVPLGIIYGGKDVETARSDQKWFKIAKLANFEGFEIRRSGFGGGLKSGVLASGYSCSL